MVIFHHVIAREAKVHVILVNCLIAAFCIVALNIFYFIHVGPFFI